MGLQNLVTAARALVACNHPVAHVQTFALVRAVAPATLARCQVCGAVRLDGGRWLATLGTVVIERELEAAEQFVAAVVRVALIGFSDLIASALPRPSGRGRRRRRWAFASAEVDEVDDHQT